MLKERIDWILEQEHRQLSAQEKLVMIAALMEWDGNNDMKVAIDVPALAAKIGFTYAQVRGCILAMHQNTWMQWSGGVRGDGRVVYYLDGVSADRVPALEGSYVR